MTRRCFLKPLQARNNLKHLKGPRFPNVSKPHWLDSPSPTGIRRIKKSRRTANPQQPRGDHEITITVQKKSPDSPLPSSPRVKDLRTRKRLISVLDQGPNQLVGRLEPGSPSKKQKRGYAEPSTHAHLRELRDHLQSGLEGESIKSLKHSESTPHILV